MKAATSLIFAGILGPVLCWSDTAVAGPCLPAADRPGFEAALVAAFAASPLDTDELYDLASNRLGYGWAGPPGTRSHALLAQRVADSLEQASDTSGAQALDVAMSGLTSGTGTTPYALADDTMAASYLEFATNMASRGPIRRLGGMRTIAQALTGPNVDLGTLLREFWFNHFNVYGDKSGWATVDYQQQIRAEQCETFAGLLRTTAGHPAMLIYLDNKDSAVGSINENYGRELLELMTLGDDEFIYYDQADVVSAATALTGWTISLVDDDPMFDFVDVNHDPQELTLFSGAHELILPAGTTVTRGEALLDHLAAHPVTVDNVCRKLVRRLMGRTPSSVVNACEAAWGPAGDMGDVLQAILTHDEMWAEAGYRRQVKSPFELVISAHRASGDDALEHNQINRIRLTLEEMGQPVGLVPPPTGYPDTRSDWASAGGSIQWHDYLFAHLGTMNVPVALDGAPAVQGIPLENALADLVATSPSGPTLNAAIDDVKLGLGLPPSFSVPFAALRLALDRGDVHLASTDIRHARTVIHGLLATPRFQRK